MRRDLARESFEMKIRKTGQLLELSRKMESQSVASREQRNPLIISAIQRKLILEFSYNGKRRTVEPQTYGLSYTGKEVLRAHEISSDSRPGLSRMAKLFDLSKIKALEKTTERFAEALPEHNPEDSAMVEIFATLPRSRSA